MLHDYHRSQLNSCAWKSFQNVTDINDCNMQMKSTRIGQETDFFSFSDLKSSNNLALAYVRNILKHITSLGIKIYMY